MPKGIYTRHSRVIKDNKKRCGKCRKYKSLEEFGKDKNTFLGYACSCKACNRERGHVYWMKKTNKPAHTPYKPNNPKNRTIGAIREDLGYIFVNMGGGKWKAQHRIVMGSFLNRSLKTYEQVHHIDGDKKNNNITNLFLYNRREHSTVHIKAQREVAKLQWENKWLKEQLKATKKEER